MTTPDTFRPEHTEKTFSSARTWEFMNKLIRGREVVDDWNLPASRRSVRRLHVRA